MGTLTLSLLESHKRYCPKLVFQGPVAISYLCSASHRIVRGALFNQSLSTTMKEVISASKKRRQKAHAFIQRRNEDGSGSSNLWSVPPWHNALASRIGITQKTQASPNSKTITINCPAISSPPPILRMGPIIDCVHCTETPRTMIAWIGVLLHIVLHL